MVQESLFLYLFQLKIRAGTTPLGSNLDRKVLQPMVLSQARNNSMQKPVLVICITDGEPTGEPKDTVRQVVMNAKQHLQNTPYGSGAVAFQFAQVSNRLYRFQYRFLCRALDIVPQVMHHVHIILDKI